LFAPFYSHEFVSNYASTVGLWFHNFEFNASLYYLAREIGYWFRGYNEIAIIGMGFSIIVFVVVIAISIFRNNKTDSRLLENMLWVITLYFVTTTTMHPWYLATPLILSIFTKYKFSLVWSLVIILSYLAYANNNNQENLWIIALEYFIVYSMILYELFFKKSKV
jgi:peptidoglycan/xylan/chitin deacetylase (PgdA/CDA1 family)